MKTHNYDPKELAKFAAMASNWWDTRGELKTLHQMNPVRLSYISKKINLDQLKVIDVGCGGGILTESLSRLGAKVTGIDMDKSVISVAKLHQLESKTQVEYLQISVEDIARERSGFYDVVTCLELLEHVPDPLSVVASCAMLAKPGGHLFFSTINRNLKSYLFAILGAEYILKLLPKNTHDYAHLIRPSELNDWMVQSGLSPQEIKGMTYNPFKQQFTLSEDIAVNYIFYAKKQ